MATILQFQPTAEAKARIERPAEGTLGEIIVFPGVRIERRGSADASRSTSTPARRRAQRSRKK
ncbi:MAG: hypothetical protein ABWZ01_00750 [Methyloceanibacter sp.]|jgi:hypothetical protein